MYLSITQNNAYFITEKQKVIFDLITCISDCVVFMLTWCTWMFYLCRLLCSVVSCVVKVWLEVSIVSGKVLQSLLVIKSFNVCYQSLTVQSHSIVALAWLRLLSFVHAVLSVSYVFLYCRCSLHLYLLYYF